MNAPTRHDTSGRELSRLWHEHLDKVPPNVTEIGIGRAYAKSSR